MMLTKDKHTLLEKLSLSYQKGAEIRTNYASFRHNGHVWLPVSRGPMPTTESKYKRIGKSISELMAEKGTQLIPKEDDD